MNEWVVIFGCILGVLVLLILVVRLTLIVGKIDSSLAKLGFVIREDAKKYFDDAAHSIVETNEKFQDTYVSIVKDGTKSALSDAGAVMEGSIAKAQQDAGEVILGAREEARRIVEAAKTEAGSYKQQALNESTATIQWVIEQYAGQTMSVEEHETIIKNLIDQYINENRQ